MLEKPHRKDAMNFLMAQSYVESVAAGLKESSTVFLQKDVTDVSKMVAQGLFTLGNVDIYTYIRQIHTHTHDKGFFKKRCDRCEFDG